jgi:hypothetical protein
MGRGLGGVRVVYGWALWAGVVVVVCTGRGGGGGVDWYQLGCMFRENRYD